jgi:hypothetical protein
VKISKDLKSFVCINESCLTSLSFVYLFKSQLCSCYGNYVILPGLCKWKNFLENFNESPF